MRPQLIAGAAIISTKIERVTDEHADIGSSITAPRTAVDVGHLPCGMVGCVVRPQFMTCASIIG